MQTAVPFEFYLSPLGKDTWSGRLPEPSADGKDGPFATLDGAREALRQLKSVGRLGGPVTVWVRGGHYPLHSPVTFTPEDSWPVTFAAYSGETPVFDGGEVISGWRVEPVNGQTAWVVDLPEVAAGRRNFRSLFVNGQRRLRARLPKVGAEPEKRNFYWMESVPGLQGPVDAMPDFRFGQERFIAREGDFREWHNLADVEVVALHFWVEERMPVQRYDPVTHEVTSSKRSIFRLTDDYAERFAKYYIDNVFEGLSEPGEWYLDRPLGRLYYLPLPGESPETTQVIAPKATAFLKLVGNPDQGQWVEHIRFAGLTFAHSDWFYTRAGWGSAEIEQDTENKWGAVEYAASPQAATHVPGVIQLQGARYCAFEDCTIQHIGGYGIELGDGCQGIWVRGCEISDLAAGGIKINGGTPRDSYARRTGNNVITDNTIAHGGRVFHSAIGVLIRHAFGNEVSHNHIHDFFYSGISCGWVWGYAESVARDNRIEKNHIHHLGFAWLSDMGGVYTLGVQPGSTIAGNYIHDVESASYGGWAIYPDEGSAHLIIENNLCHDTSQQPFHEHYGRENIVRNNIFAFGKKAQIALSRADPHRSFTFSRNIVITEDQPIYTGGYGADLRERPFGADLNLYWSASSAPIVVDATGKNEVMLTWAEWQKLGYDRHSIVADPGFADLARRDFTLLPGSPARDLGFVPIDLSDVGPRTRK